MALTVWREYLGKWQEVGSFSGYAPSVSFAYSPEYLALVEAVPLSQSLPLRLEQFERGEFQPFFEGMLPEGPVRTELAHRFQVSPSDYLTLLERIGGECVGALSFCRQGEEPPVAGYRHLEEAEVSGLQGDEVDCMATSMQSSRLSLAGAQSKTGWMLSEGVNPAKADLGSWMVPMGSAPSTHVIKVSSPRHRLLPQNEYVCMETARCCGLKVARSWVSETLPGVFISERYDRSWAQERLVGGVPAPLRLHQEDFCQSLGWPSYMKYENQPNSCYAREAGGVIRRVCADVIGDKCSFARQLAFDYLVGNCDSHMKNHSILWSPDWHARRLAPAYDIVCTTIMGYDHNLGIDIGDHRVIDEVGPQDLELLAEDVGMPVRTLAQDCAVIVERAPETLKMFADSEGDMGEVAAAILKDAEGRLDVLRRFVGTHA